MTIGNFFQYFGLLAEIIGLTIAIQGENKTQYHLSIAIGMFFITLFSLYSNNLSVRVLISSIFFFALYIYLFSVTIKTKHKTLVIGFVSVFSIVFATVHLIRGVMAVSTSHNMEIFTNNTIQGVLGIIYIVITFIFPVFLLLIVNEKDNKKLSELNATKSKFFRIISHDLKAPFAQLHTIAQLIEMQKENLNPSELEKLSKVIMDSSLRTSKLLDDVLTWAQVEGESVSIHPENLDANALASENIELIKHKAEEKGIQLINNIHVGHQVYCDKNLFNTILRNLISNAIKFSFDNNNIEIESVQNEKSCIISVKDYGIGIDKTKIKDIFQIDSDYTTLGTHNEKGTGVGLSLCKEFIEVSKGEIWVESILNKVTTFHFSLPIAQSE